MTWILTEEGFDVIIVNTQLSLPEKRVCIEALRALVPGVQVLDLAVGAETPPYDTGANAYLAKPFHAMDLIARVRGLTAPPA